MLVPLSAKEFGGEKTDSYLPKRIHRNFWMKQEQGLAGNINF